MPKRPSSSRERSTSSAPEGARRPRGVALALIAIVRAYRLLVAPLLPRSCRFAPSCSAFALEAIERHGAWVGARLAVARVLRCHPWHPGGYDPVPVAGEER